MDINKNYLTTMLMSNMLKTTISNTSSSSSISNMFDMMFQTLINDENNTLNLFNDSESQEEINTITSNKNTLLDSIPIIYENNILNLNNNTYSTSNTSYSPSDKSTWSIDEVLTNLKGQSNNYKSETGNTLEFIKETVEKYSNMYNVDSNLIYAIIKQESNFDPNVVSSAGAMGLMQLMDFNCKSYGVTNPLDIEQNIKGGIMHIKEYLNMYDGNVEMALMAYNGGPGTMERRGVSNSNDLYKMPKETQNYVPKVINYYKNGINI